MAITRRSFMRYAQAAGLFFSAASMPKLAHGYTANAGLPLVADDAGLVDLPEGFSYKVVSTTGGKMSDGLLRPGRPDGMACFPHPRDAGKCIVMRNHENWPDTLAGGAFGAKQELLARVRTNKLYDFKNDGSPYLGGVTKVVYDLENKRLERDFLVLAGTSGNCAGGRTPWGSWLSCEESAITPDDGAGKFHGFVFEVPASSRGLVKPRPYKEMGRFTHEAAAVDPDTGIVYMTEDRLDGAFYRFLPSSKGNLARGGRLQALVIKGWSSADTRNWARDWGGGGIDAVKVGQAFETEWIDLEEVEAPEGDLAVRARKAGAATFCRGEGLDYGRPPDGQGRLFFNCTQGGAQRVGQVWSYTPDSEEALDDAGAAGGELELVYESPGADWLDMCDNLAYAPWGDLILCEDGPGAQYLRGLTPGGRLYDLARNVHEGNSEFCGACFSPDGSVLFVNIQEPGITLAIEGPWQTLRT